MSEQNDDQASTPDASRGGNEDDHERYESLRHPSSSDPSVREARDRREHEHEHQQVGEGRQTGGKRGLVGRMTEREPGQEPDLPRNQPPSGAEPEQTEARAEQPAGLRRYRGTEEGFRVEPGPLSREDEPPRLRSDEVILHDVEKVLEQDGMIEADEIEVHVERGQVALTGHVGSERMRRRAADVVTRVAGVRRVANELAV